VITQSESIVENHTPDPLLAPAADTALADIAITGHGVLLVLEFLDLKGEYSESDLAAELIERLTEFLLEPGDEPASGGRNSTSKKLPTAFDMHHSAG
jgi:hypothetical protein